MTDARHVVAQAILDALNADTTHNGGGYVDGSYTSDAVIDGRFDMAVVVDHFLTNPDVVAVLTAVEVLK